MTNKFRVFPTTQPKSPSVNPIAPTPPKTPANGIIKPASIVSGGIILEDDPREDDDPDQKDAPSEGGDTWGGFNSV
jgi:hypothetical protein